MEEDIFVAENQRMFVFLFLISVIFLCTVTMYMTKLNYFCIIIVCKSCIISNLILYKMLIEDVYVKEAYELINGTEFINVKLSILINCFVQHSRQA